MRRRLLILSALVLVVSLAIDFDIAAQNSAEDGYSPALAGKPWATYGTKTDTSNLALQGAQGAGLSTYVTMAYCLNTSASTAQVAFLKYSTTTIAVINCTPAAGWVQPTYFDPPLRVGTNVGLTMNGVGSVSTTYLFAQGTIAR